MASQFGMLGGGGGALVARKTTDGTRSATDGGSLISAGGSGNAVTRRSDRTSGLQAPIMELAGHGGEAFGARFDPTGRSIASCSMDRTIMLWRTYGGCDNYGVLRGHAGAVLDLRWTRDSEMVFSASADASLASWNLETGRRIRRYVGHEGSVNGLDLGRRGQETVYSASDDGFVGVWDPRSRTAVRYIDSGLPLTSVAVSETGTGLYSAGVDDAIKVWDLRQQSVVYTLTGHADVVTSLAISPDGNGLLSNSLDSTVRLWDIRPLAPTSRAIGTLAGSVSGIEKNLIRASWSPDGKLVAAGSEDRLAVIWQAETGKILYKLPGHKGSVNDVQFSPTEPSIVLSASSDRSLLLGELSQ